MENRRRFTKKFCRYTANKVDYLDYKEPNSFRFSISERYKIMPRRLTGTSKKYQDMVEIAVKRARHMAIVPYVVTRDHVVENPFEDIMK
jgi:small subunit ribosomal protein S18